MEITIKLSVEKWNVVMQALGERPYVQVAALIAEMNEQAKPQMTSADAE